MRPGRRGWAWIAGGALAITLFLNYCVRFVPPGQPDLQQTVSSPRGFVIPVQGMTADQLVDTFTQARAAGERRHDAIDIMAPRGMPVVAAARGTVEKLFTSEQGGLTLYIRSPDRKWVHYYAHLNSYRAGLHEGQAVRAGEPIATLGSTGNADPSGPHLHFAINRMSPGDRWYQGTPVNPYPLLVNTRR